MVSNLSCLIVTGEEFPEKKLSELLAPNIIISEFDYANSLSNAFQFLLNSNFNLCLIGARYQEGYESFFKDMKVLGRDKTCAFVKVYNTSSMPGQKINLLPDFGFCSTISTELNESDLNSLRQSLYKEVVRISEEQKVEDIPKYVELVLREVDVNARKLQRGIKAPYDKVIAGLVRDMMSDESIHRDGFIEKLLAATDGAECFEATSVDVPEIILKKNLPKLVKTKYEGSSSRVWNKLLKRYGDKNGSK